MNPQATLLPFTYGISEAVAITCLILSAISLLLAVIVPIVFQAAGKPWVPAAVRWFAVFVWALFTSMTATRYVDDYSAAVASLQTQPPVPSDQVATAALVLQLQPTMWAVKMILLGLLGALAWVGNSRSRAAAAMLLAYSNMPVAQTPAVTPAETRSVLERQLRIAGDNRPG